YKAVTFFLRGRSSSLTVMQQVWEDCAMRGLSVFGIGIMVFGGLCTLPLHAREPKATPADKLAAAKQSGLDWLTKNQEQHGYRGRTHTLAVPSFACLAYLSASDEPFRDQRGKALLKGIEFL